MLACVYPGLFLHTHTYTPFALSYPLFIISHPFPLQPPSALRLPQFLSPLESWRVMWTAREEGWEKDERSGVKKERDVVGVIAESSHGCTVCVGVRLWECLYLYAFQCFLNAWVYVYCSSEWEVQFKHSCKPVTPFPCVFNNTFFLMSSKYQTWCHVPLEHWWWF